MYIKHLGQCLVYGKHSVHDNDEESEESSFKQKYSFLKTPQSIIIKHVYSQRKNVMIKSGFLMIDLKTNNMNE